MFNAVEGRRSIHVVDSDKLNRQQLTQFLRVSGFEVQEHICGNDFIEQVDHVQVGCAIVAMRMPRMSGLDVLRWRRRQQCTAPMLMVADRTDVAAAMEALRLGAEDVLTTPLSEHAVLDHVNHILEVSQERQVTGALRHEAHVLAMQLSERERQIVALILTGLGTKQIAYRLHLSYKTVENRRSGIYQKLGVECVAELVAMIVPLLGGCCRRKIAERETGCGLQKGDRVPCRLNDARTEHRPCPLCSRRNQCTQAYDLPAIASACRRAG